MLPRGGTIRLQIPSNYELLDLIQLVCDRLAALAALDEDAVHWIGVAVREYVINAIKHGNRRVRQARHRGVFVDARRDTHGIHCARARPGPGL